jgi:predicted lipoprotein with Yx(FWY)xxD motif
MRKPMFASAALALTLCAGLAAAQSMPAGVQTQGGALADASGKPLYTYDMDTMKGMSHCNDRCATYWPPLPAPAGAQGTGDWSVVTRDDGSRQWAYKDKPLYTFVKDQAAQPGTGESVPHWKLAR